MSRLFGAIIACSTAIACSSGDSAKPTAKDAAPAPKAPDAAPVISDPAYQANAAGLQSLIRDLLDARQAGAAERTYVLTESLRLREYEAWFEKTFGPKLGAKLAKDYKIQFDDIQLLADTLAKLRDEGRTEIAIERFESTDDLKAVGYQIAALAAMKEPVALFSVRMSAKDDKRSFHIWSFIHDGKSFRYVGKMKPVAKPEPSELGDLGELRVVDAKRLRPPDKTDDDDDKDDE